MVGCISISFAVLWRQNDDNDDNDDDTDAEVKYNTIYCDLCTTRGL